MSKSKTTGKGKKDDHLVEVIAIIEPEFIDGKGAFIFPDNSKYEGDYQLNTSDGTKKRHGSGSMTWSLHPVEKYVGQWLDDRMNGIGTYSFASGTVYDGGMRDNLFDGEGTYLFYDGAKYTGHWLQNKMHGSGMYVDATGVTWSGEFFHGMYDSGKNHVSLRPTEGI